MSNRLVKQVKRVEWGFRNREHSARRYDSTAPARTGRAPDLILIAAQQSKSPDSTYPDKEQ
jgi:hypothetical protein